MQGNGEGLDGWTTFKSKKTLKAEKRREKPKVKKEQPNRRQRDVRYLLTHTGFQNNRLRQQYIEELLQDYKEKPKVTIRAYGRCRGHAFAHDDCLECRRYSRNRETPINAKKHCCCSEDIQTSLPPNFYLGNPFTLDEYLYYMRDT